MKNTHAMMENAMKKNMGSIDRALRIGAALVVIGLMVSGIISGTLAIVLGVVSAVFLLTSLAGICPLYSLLGVATCKKSE